MYKLIDKIFDTVIKLLTFFSTNFSVYNYIILKESIVF